MEVDYKILLENLLHELATINSLIKSSAETLSKSAKGNLDKPSMVHHSEVILENSFLFSTQLDIVNYQLNPKYISEVEKFEKRNLFGKFHKALISFKRITKSKRISFSTKGEIDTLIDSKPVIDTLPMLILDNAIKYSIKDSVIEIDFSETNNDVEVKVSNMGPYINPKEIKQLFSRGFRGSEAIKTNLPGHGCGLNFIKFICDIHNGNVSVESSDSVIKIGEISYSKFSIKITLPKQN
jgi:signal transduction histidine kinase